MSAPQTSVDSVMPIGLAGQAADLHTDEFGKTASYVNAEATDSIPFGVMIKDTGIAGESPEVRTATKLGAQTDDLGGIVLRAHDYDTPSEMDDVGLVPGVSFQALRVGNILVISEEDITDETSAVHVRVSGEDLTASPPKVLGGFRKTKDSTHTVDISAFATWRGLGTAGTPVELEIDLVGTDKGIADS